MAPQPDLTFDHLTPTRGSRLARKLGVALAEDTADAPSFLLLHGPPGVGKTHLLHAILNLRTARQPRRPSIEIGADQLVERWIAAIKGDPKEDLPRRLERSDLVAIDHLHVLAGKPVTQGEIARALEATVRRGGRVVGAAGCSPADLPVLTSRFRRLPLARFVEMRPPRGHDLRRILSVMASAARLNVPGEILAAIAGRCVGDVRRAQGEMTRRRFEQSHPLVPDPLLGEKR